MGIREEGQGDRLEGHGGPPCEGSRHQGFPQAQQRSGAESADRQGRRSGSRCPASRRTHQQSRHKIPAGGHEHRGPSDRGEGPVRLRGYTRTGPSHEVLRPGHPARSPPRGGYGPGYRMRHGTLQHPDCRDRRQGGLHGRLRGDARKTGGAMPRTRRIQHRDRRIVMGGLRYGRGIRSRILIALPCAERSGLHPEDGILLETQLRLHLIRVPRGQDGDRCLEKARTGHIVQRPGYPLPAWIPGDRRNGAGTGVLLVYFRTQLHRR